MGNFRVISKDIKDQIINRIKNEGIPAIQAARDAGISPNTVYGWISKQVNREPGIIEMNKLKRENQFLMTLLGKLTMEKELRGKK
jgi:transposase-like protein